MALIDGTYTLEFFSICSFGAFFLIIVSATENNARLSYNSSATVSKHARRNKRKREQHVRTVTMIIA